MDRKARILMKSAVVLALFATVFYISFGLAVHTVSTAGSGGATTNVYTVEDLGFVYNISVNNSDTLSPNANITQVNISLPSGFLFIIGENGSSADNAGITFTNYTTSTETALSWSAFGDYVINSTATAGGQIESFWFNATASTPGNYNITVTTVNATGVYQANISVQINDTTPPVVQASNFKVPTSFANISGTHAFNVTVTDVVGIDMVFFNVTNSSGGFNGTFMATASGDDYLNSTIDTTIFVDGNYVVRVWANDTAGNVNNTALINFTVDNTNPINTTFSAGTSGSGINVTRNWTFVNITFIESNIANITFNLYNHTGKFNESTQFNTSITYLNWTNLPDGNYTYNVTIMDFAGNTNSTTSRTIRIDTTGPVISLSQSGDSDKNNNVIAVTIVEGSGVSGECSLPGNSGYSVTGDDTKSQVITHGGLTCGTAYTYTVRCTDILGQEGDSAEVSYSTDACSTGGASSSGGGGTSNKQTAWKTKKENSEPLKERGTVVAKLKKNERIIVDNKGDAWVGVKDVLSSTKAVVSYQSSPEITYTLSVGQSWKVPKDGRYVALIKLDSIKNNVVSLSVAYLDEKIPQPSLSPEVEEDVVPEPVPEAEQPVVETTSGGGTVVAVLVGVGIVVLVIIIFAMKGGKGKKAKGKKRK